MWIVRSQCNKPHLLYFTGYWQEEDPNCRVWLFFWVGEVGNKVCVDGWLLDRCCTHIFILSACVSSPPCWLFSVGAPYCADTVWEHSERTDAAFWMSLIMPTLPITTTTVLYVLLLLIMPELLYVSHQQTHKALYCRNAGKFWCIKVLWEEHQYHLFQSFRTWSENNRLLFCCKEASLSQTFLKMTYHFFLIVWWFSPWEPTIFWMHII